MPPQCTSRGESWSGAFIIVDAATDDHTRSSRSAHTQLVMSEYAARDEHMRSSLVMKRGEAWRSVVKRDEALFARCRESRHHEVKPLSSSFRWERAREAEFGQD